MTSSPLPLDSDHLATVARYRPLDQLLPPHWTQDTVVANGARHHYYRTGGAKPPVLLLHGFLDGAASWLRVARALESDFDVIMPNARGHGQSQRSGAQYDPEQMAEDVAAIAQALGLEAVRVLGHSMGAGTALLLADRHPGLVRAAIAEGWDEEQQGGPNLAQSPGYQAWYHAFVSWLERLKTQDHAERMTSGLSQLPPGAPLLPEEEYVPWLDNAAHLDLELVRHGATIWGRAADDTRTAAEALRHTQCPVLIMKSDHFPTPGERRVVDQPSGQPNVRVVRFEHTGHLIHRDAFEAFVALAQEFFRGVP